MRAYLSVAIPKADRFVQESRQRCQQCHNEPCEGCPIRELIEHAERSHARLQRMASRQNPYRNRTAELKLWWMDLRGTWEVRLAKLLESAGVRCQWVGALKQHGTGLLASTLPELYATHRGVSVV